VWHTHQLSSLGYDRWCHRNLGRRINHDDTLGDNTLTDGLDFTKQAWKNAYNEDYLAATIVKDTPEPYNPKFIYPPQDLTPNQRRLWDVDLEKQKEHEKFEYELLQLREKPELIELQRRLKVAEEALHHASIALSISGQPERPSLRPADVQTILQTLHQTIQEVDLARCY
jgi:hypothetical protein